MKQKEIAQQLIPVQPYLEKNTVNYQCLPYQANGIAHFYEFTMNEETEAQLQAVPDGCVDISFSISGNDIHTVIGGTVLKVKKWLFHENQTYFGIRFLPGQCLLPEDITISEIIDEDLEIQGRCYGLNMAEQLAQAENIRERARIFLKEYLDQADRVRKSGDNVLFLEEYMKSRIYESRGKINIRELSKETGFSECYMRRVFQQIHGVAPKTFERFVRFQYLLQDLDRKQGVLCLEDMALEHGYYDQSHMINEFKCYAGVTPDVYLKMPYKNKRRLCNRKNK